MQSLFETYFTSNPIVVTKRNLDKCDVRQKATQKENFYIFHPEGVNDGCREEEMLISFFTRLLIEFYSPLAKNQSLQSKTISDLLCFQSFNGFLLQLE